MEATLKLSPETAPQLAERSIAFVEQKFGYRLIYTPESLILVDAIVDKIRETGASEQQAAGLLCGLGCYAGEVFVRHARASWRAAAQIGAGGAYRFQIVLALPGAIACDPIGRVFQRFGGGPADSVALLFDGVVDRPAEAAGPRAT